MFGARTIRKQDEAPYRSPEKDSSSASHRFTIFHSITVRTLNGRSRINATIDSNCSILTASSTACSTLLSLKVSVIPDSTLYHDVLQIPVEGHVQHLCHIRLEKAEANRSRKAELHVLPSARQVEEIIFFILSPESVAVTGFNGDQENFSSRLQSLPPTKAREPDATIRLTYVETLLLLCHTRWGHDHQRQYGA
ncbi:hypothetical protein BYT27DRAFT_7265687 [Phlegmacium glaucopus]|nr:hypothetical protein BYT27DRAFT_7265687 [Phlegmacium glaucopus]